MIYLSFIYAYFIWYQWFYGYNNAFIKSSYSSTYSRHDTIKSKGMLVIEIKVWITLCSMIMIICMCLNFINNI